MSKPVGASKISDSKIKYSSLNLIVSVIRFTPKTAGGRGRLDLHRFIKISLCWCLNLVPEVGRAQGTGFLPLRPGSTRSTLHDSPHPAALDLAPPPFDSCVSRPSSRISRFFQLAQILWNSTLSPAKPATMADERRVQEGPDRKRKKGNLGRNEFLYVRPLAPRWLQTLTI